MSLLVSEQDSKKVKKSLNILMETGKKGIILAGRPYHTDPEVNHGIDKMIKFIPG